MKKLCFLILLLTRVVCASEIDLIEERLEQQQRYKVQGWCLVPWQEKQFSAQILSLEEDGVRVKVFDASLPFESWPEVSFSWDEVVPFYCARSETMQELVESLEERSILQSETIKEAFTSIDRAWFCPNCPYYDAAIDIGKEVCISTPHMHVWALELSKHLFGQATRILDVGAGSGYLTAMYAYLAPQAQVFGIDFFEEFAHKASQTCSQHLSRDIYERMRFMAGDGEQGYSEGAPYDIIHVGFMCQSIPQPLIDQLKPGGRLIIPIGSKESSYDSRLLGGNLVVVDKQEDGSMTVHTVLSCSYVPSMTRKSE